MPTGSSPRDGGVATLQKWWFWKVLHPLYWRISRLERFDRRVQGHGPLLVAMGDSITDPCVGFVFPWQVWLRRVGVQGYKTVNLGIGSHNTTHMCQRVEEFFGQGHPDIAVLFAGNVDAEYGIDPADTERNVRFIVSWLQKQGVRKIVLVGPGILNLPYVPEYMPGVTDWSASIAVVRLKLREIATEHDVVFVDLAQFLGDRIARGDDPDFSRVPYRQSRSWHAVIGDGHFNAYGQRLVAEAFLAATEHWRPESHVSRRSLLGWRRGKDCVRATHAGTTPRAQAPAHDRR